MFKYIFFLTFIFSSQAYTFITTKNTYNGTITYDGLFKACLNEYRNSKPCTRIQLLDKFWKQNIAVSWILEIDINCVGYTTDSEESIGTCIVKQFGQLTECSCNMNIPICCYT